MKKRILSVVAVFALTGTMAFGQLKIYNSELLKIGNVNETPDITTGFEVSMPNVYLKSGSYGMKFSNSKFRIGDVASMNSLSTGFEVAMPALRLVSGNTGLSIGSSQVRVGGLTSSANTYIRLDAKTIGFAVEGSVLQMAKESMVTYVPKSGWQSGGGGTVETSETVKGNIVRLQSIGLPMMMGSAAEQLVGVYSTRYYSTSATGISSLSDARYKTNVRPMEAAVGKVMEMNPVRFDYANIDSLGNKVADSTRSNRVGFIAQELIEVCPEAVGYDPYEDFYTVDYSVLIPFLVKAVQEQQAEIEALKAALKAKEE